MSSAPRRGVLSVKAPWRAADYAGVIDLVAFSKDRPAQLDLLLRSIRRFAPAGVQTAVVFTASEHLHGRGYAVVREAHPWVRWVDEREAGGFKAATLSLVADAGDRLGFLVDDI